MISELGVASVGMAAFTIGVVAGWVFALGTIHFVVRILMWAISDRKEIE